MSFAVLRLCQKCSSRGMVQSTIFQTWSMATVWKRSLFYKKKYLYDRGKVFNLLYGEHQSRIFSPEGLNRYLKDRDLEKQIDSQRFNAEMFSKLGPDRWVATFVLAFKGRVKLKNDTVWLSNPESLHGISLVEVEGIDMSNMMLYPAGLDNLRYLDHLRYVKFNPYVTDWYLFHLQTFQDSLECIDLSGCRYITEAGLTSLVSLRNLKYLDISGCTKVQNPEIVVMQLESLIPDLVTMGLEALPSMDNKSLENELESSRFLKMGESVERVLRDKKLIGEDIDFDHGLIDSENKKKELHV